MVFDLVISALRIIFLFLLPVIALTVLASLLAAALQSALSIREPAFGYAIRLGAVAAALYFVLPGIIESLNQLFLSVVQ